MASSKPIAVKDSLISATVSASAEECFRPQTLLRQNTHNGLDEEPENHADQPSELAEYLIARQWQRRKRLQNQVPCLHTLPVVHEYAIGRQVSVFQMATL